MAVLFKRDESSFGGRSGSTSVRPAADLPPGELTIEYIVENRLVSTEFQPIVGLGNGGAVAFEAYARGPADTKFSTPLAMFEAAARVGLTAKLDQAAHAAAYRAALTAKLHPSLSLFLNADPAVLGVEMSDDLAGLIAVALSKLRVLIEISERHLADNPSAALAGIARARACGWGISWDHLGATPDSLALMPFVQPDVVKLDVSLVHQRFHPDAARVVNAVIAYAERSGASVMATGIETREHLQTALGMGAELGQGYYFGRPGPLPTGSQPPLKAVPLVAAYEAPDAAVTPFELFTAVRPAAPASMSMLGSLAQHLEQRCSIDPEPAVVLTSLTEDQLVSGAPVARLQMIARNAAFVAALLAEPTAYPISGVRTATFAPDDRLRGEWNLAVVGPHFAALLTGRRNPAATGVSDEVLVGLTYDRDVVLHAARSLLQRLTDAQDPAA